MNEKIEYTTEFYPSLKWLFKSFCKLLWERVKGNKHLAGKPVVVEFLKNGYYRLSGAEGEMVRYVGEKKEDCKDEDEAGS